LTVRWYTGLFDLAHAGKLWIWDAQWTFAMWIQSGLAVSPQDDLIRNIGFGEDATNTGAAADLFDQVGLGGLI
jgi:hypothetical protein